MKSGGYYLTENSSVETSIVDIVNTTPAPIVVKTTKQVIPAYTGDVIANDLYQKYLGKICKIHHLFHFPKFVFGDVEYTTFEKNGFCFQVSIGGRPYITSVK